MWSEEAVAHTRKRWAEGASASQIARELPREFGPIMKKTRNAVIGKIHRLGLQARITPCRPPKQGPRRASRIRFIPNSVIKPVRMRLPDANLADLRTLEPLCFEGGRPRTILTIRDSECRFTAGEGADAPLCGRACVGSWCSQHQRLVYQPTRKRELEDASVARVARWLDRKARASEAFAA